MIAIANSFKAPLLQLVIDYLAGLGDLPQVHTIKSAITITSATTLAALLAAESDFPGYSPPGLAMNTAFLNGANQGESDGDAVTFSRSSSSGGAQNIYGYFVTDNNALVLFWGETLAVPKAMDSAGAVWVLAPRLLLDNLS